MRKLLLAISLFTLGYAQADEYWLLASLNPDTPILGMATVVDEVQITFLGLNNSAFQGRDIHPHKVPIQDYSEYDGEYQRGYEYAVLAGYNGMFDEEEHLTIKMQASFGFKTSESCKITRSNISGSLYCQSSRFRFKPAASIGISFEHEDIGIGAEYHWEYGKVIKLGYLGK